MKEINVLFLDDEQNVLNSIRRMFAAEPYGVAVAGNAKEALEILSREKIKVVLSDQRMPDITGVEFLRQIKSQYPQIVRILFTAYADLQATEAAINISEVYRFINKPWHPEELKTAVAGAMHYFDVIEENKRLFEETKLKNEELNLANCKLKRLYAMQKEFSSTLSHELRTPLAAIMAAIEIMLSETAGSVTQEQKKLLEKVNLSTDRLNRLINNILELAQMESGKVALNKKPEDINKIIRSVADTLDPVAKNKGLSLKLNLDPKVPVIDLEQEKIVQVLNNLIANALKFTESGGVTVTSKTDEDKHQIEVRVADTGDGIKDEDLNKLFEKFQQLGEAHQRQAGTGLGLAIAKEIIRRHGGKVGVESKVGLGSCFYFIIPTMKGQGYGNA